MYVSVKREDDAKDYRVVFQEVFAGWEGVYITNTPARSWTNENFSAEYVTENGASYDVLAFKASGCAGSDGTNQFLGRYATISGFAQVTVHLK